jgi:hypothetical protein
MIGGGLVGVAHTEIDDVITRRPGLLFKVTNDIKNVWREALDTPKLIVHDKPTLLGAPAKARGFKKVGNSTESAPRCQRSAGLKGNIDAS